MIYLLLILQVSAKEKTFVNVQTSQGKILGQVTTSQYGALATFYGVPYAMVDESNKFGEARPYPNIKNFIALNASESCPHINGGVIQCLTLNIIMPIIKTPEQFPVLVWFFGGFTMKNPEDYDGRHIAKHGVIVVTVNYRVGPYGFFCLDDIKNQGLKDQNKAIKWVNNNIEAFRGDPDKITIGGQSYGGGAVDFHLYDKERYFNKAIIQSGSKFAKGITSIKDNTAPIKIASYLQSKAKDTKGALKFLNELDPVKVMTATKILNLKFGICKDADEYVDHIKNTPILIGYNSKEDFAMYTLKPKEFYQNEQNIFLEYLSENFHLDNDTINAFSILVKDFYLGSTVISQDRMLGLVDFSSDVKLNLPVEKSVKKYLKCNATKVYKYFFSYTGRSPFKNIPGVGASHAEELQYLFEKDPHTFNAEQTVVRDKMTKMWANFVKYGAATESAIPIKSIVIYEEHNLSSDAHITNPRTKGVFNTMIPVTNKKVKITTKIKPTMLSLNELAKDSVINRKLPIEEVKITDEIKPTMLNLNEMAKDSEIDTELPTEEVKITDEIKPTTLSLNEMSEDSVINRELPTEGVKITDKIKPTMLSFKEMAENSVTNRELPTEEVDITDGIKPTRLSIKEMSEDSVMNKELPTEEVKITDDVRPTKLSLNEMTEDSVINTELPNEEVKITDYVRPTKFSLNEMTEEFTEEVKITDEIKPTRLSLNEITIGSVMHIELPNKEELETLQKYMSRLRNMLKKPLLNVNP